MISEKEYIDRNELIDDFQNDLINLHFDGLKGTPRPKEIKIVNVIERIEGFPVADVAPVKHGHWRARMSTTTSVKCTCCNHYYEYETPYCPNCGAKMNGGNENA